MKTALNSLLVLLGAVLAHAISCGAFIPILPFAVISLALLAVLRALKTSELEGPKLALVILFVQSAAHFGLGGMSMNTARMLLAHFLAGAVSYLFIRKNEKFWNFSGYAVFSLIRCLTLKPANFQLDSVKVRASIPEYLHLLNEFLRSATSRLPAPPKSASALKLPVSFGC